ncbi:MAG: hypothetical protein ACTSXC_06420 [Candidatus Freyarchaeota archaeon]
MLLMLVHRISIDHFRRATRSIKYDVKVKRCDVEFLDSLSYDEALLVCAYMEKMGFRAGRHYDVYRCGARYGLAIRRSCYAKAIPLIRDLGKAKCICAIALKILKHWRGKTGKVSGDIYEALDAAFRISRVRDRLFSSVCPNCGGHGVMARESIQGDSYIIYVKRICCKRRETIKIPLSNRSANPRS